MTGTEQVLVNGWCQQFPSHSVGTLLFGRDGDLYVTGGDGASFNKVDYGQFGNTYAGDQANPCGDPPGAVGTALSPPGAEGGALRSQSVRRTDGPATLNGAVLRIDPATGAGVPGNPFYSSPDANARRIVAYGLRNPFRITQRPGTDELWIGDVGWNTWEEINRVVAPTSATASNFGWPCYEGASPQSGYQGAGLNLCSSLYSTPGSVTAPYYAYNHSACVVNYTGCHTGGSSITGVAFYRGGAYPAAYDGALFFADHTRNEIWAMLPGTNGLPDPSKLQSFVGVDAAGGAAGHPVDLKIGPGGDLFYVDMDDGTIHRITYTAAVGNTTPVAVIHSPKPSLTATHRTAARISAVSETRRVFAPGSGHKRGTVFSFRLDQPSQVKIAIQREEPGRRVSHSCRRPSSRLRHKPRCTRTIRIAVLIKPGHAGHNAFAFSGRVRGRALPPGRYLAVFATSGSRTARTLHFRIVRP
jgi:glucose/arabinose dehydrogenase